MPPKMSSVDEESPTRERIVEAARICFMRDGVRRTTMSHVAEEAGVVRQTLYDWVSSKEELVDLAMVRRTRELGELMRARKVDDRLAVGEQIVGLLAAMVQAAGTDPEFELLAQAMPERHAFAFLAGPSELTDMVESLLTPFFDRARAEGRLRDERGTKALAAWSQLVLAPLRNRADLSLAEVEETLRYFLLPALLHE